MYINQKIELILTDNQKRIFDSQSRLCIKAYNLMLEISLATFEHHKSLKYVKVSDLVSLFHEIARTKKYLYSIHPSSKMNIIFILKRELEKKIKIPSYIPKYKSQYKTFFQLHYDIKDIKNPIKRVMIDIPLGSTLQEDEIINIETRIKLSQRINIRRNGKIVHYKIIRKYMRYYLIVCVSHHDFNYVPKTEKSISIDPNHKNFFVAIDNHGESFQFENPPQIKYFDNKIDDLKSKLSKSKNKKRCQQALHKLYHKRNAQITEFIYKVCHFLVNNYDTVAIGDYTSSTKGIIYREMKRKMINQSIISKFRKTLTYVALIKGKNMKVIDEYLTTKTCHICGNIKHMKPSDRVYICNKCNAIIHRDINSAINIGKKAKILSYSDYNTFETRNVLYIVNYDYRMQNLVFTKLK